MIPYTPVVGRRSPHGNFAQESPQIPYDEPTTNDLSSHQTVTQVDAQSTTDESPDRKRTLVETNPTIYLGAEAAAALALARVRRRPNIFLSTRALRRTRKAEKFFSSVVMARALIRLDSFSIGRPYLHGAARVAPWGDFGGES